MKTVEYYMKQLYKLEIFEDTEEGGYIASYPELKGCISYGRTIAETVELAIDAKRAWIKAAVEDGYDIPEAMTDEQYSGQFKLRLPKSLHRQLSERAKKEGISMNQYCLYLLTKYDAMYSANQ